jgi:hypothetical protein
MLVPTSRQRGRAISTGLLLSIKINIWSWDPDGARHQGRQTDWLSVVKWLWIWLRLWLWLTATTRCLLTKAYACPSDCDRRSLAVCMIVGGSHTCFKDLFRIYENEDRRQDMLVGRFLFCAELVLHVYQSVQCCNCGRPWALVPWPRVTTRTTRSDERYERYETLRTATLTTIRPLKTSTAISCSVGCGHKVSVVGM